MLGGSLMLAQEGFQSNLNLEGYWGERKYDGCRCLATKEGLFGRTLSPISSFPDISTPEADNIFDGEIICDTFSHLQTRIHTKDNFKINLLSKHYPARFIAFDLLRLEGEDLRQCPLSERRELLESVSKPDGYELSERSFEPLKLFERVLEEGGEGVMLKKINSVYSGKRSPDWKKVKTWKELDVEILDYTSEKRDISALVTDKGKVNFTGQNAWKEKILNHAKLFAKVIYLELTPQGVMRFPKLKEVYEK